VQSPFLLIGYDQADTLDGIRRDEVLSPLRSALLDRARSYADPKSPFYLGSAAWEAGQPLLLRQSTLPMIRYYCAALLDMGFASYVEVGQDIRRNGARLLLRTMDDLRSDFRIPSAASPCDLLVPTSELLAEITLAYDLLARGLDSKDRGPFLAALEEERAFLSSNVRRLMPEIVRPEQRIDVAACLGLVTLFSSATFADRENRRSYQRRYGSFVNDLLWATETLGQSWEELASTPPTEPLEDLEYPAFHTLALVETLRRIGGPDLLPSLPVGSIVTAVWNRKIPHEASVIDRTRAGADPAAPDTWPPAVRNIFWNKGEGPGTDAPTPIPIAPPTPTPAPRQIVKFGQHLRAIRSKTPPPNPTPTPVIGWSPPRRTGVPSLWGPVLLYLGRRGDALALEIWQGDGKAVSSHPATLAWYTAPDKTGPISRPREPSIWSDDEGSLLAVRSSDPGGTVFARQVSEDGQTMGSYLVAERFRRRLLERIEMLAAGQVLTGTDARLLSPGYVLSTQRRGGFEWTTVSRTHVSLGLPYVVSIVRASSDTVGVHRIDLPLESDEEVVGGTSTPSLITLSYPERATPTAQQRRLPFSKEREGHHLRLVLSSMMRARGHVVKEGERNFLHAVQPLQNGAAFVALALDTWERDGFVVEPAELEEGLGVVIPWQTKGYDLIAVNTGRGIRGPTVETDARLVVLSWDTTHDQVAYLLADGTYLRATSSRRKGSLRDLIDRTRGPVTVSWSGETLVFAEGSDLRGSYYAPGLSWARQGSDLLVAYRHLDRVTLSRKPARGVRSRSINADSNER
jgi:hypothetical protein